MSPIVPDHEVLALLPLSPPPHHPQAPPRPTYVSCIQVMLAEVVTATKRLKNNKSPESETAC